MDNENSVNYFKFVKKDNSRDSAMDSKNENVSGAADQNLRKQPLGPAIELLDDTQNNKISVENSKLTDKETIVDELYTMPVNSTRSSMDNIALENQKLNITNGNAVNNQSLYNNQAGTGNSFGANQIVKETYNSEIGLQINAMEQNVEAFQDNGNIQLNQDEAWIFTKYNTYIRDLYLNDFIIASIVCDMYRNSIRYNFEADEWISWQGAYWLSSKELLTGCIYNAIESYRRCLTYNISTNSDNPSRNSNKRFLVANINRFASTNKIEAIIKLLKTFVPLRISNSDINKQKDIIVYNNTPINLRNGNVSQTAYFHVNHIDIPVIRQPGFIHSESDEFSKFVDKIFDGDNELIEFVQKAIGYCLSGETDAGYFFIACGEGNNGKTTFMDCIRNAMGDYATEIPFKYLTSSQVNINTLPELENARTKRLLIFKSSNHYQDLNKDILKALSNGSSINIKHSRGRQYSYIPDFKIWINLDELPRIENIDDVFWQRLCIIPFKNKFEFQELKSIYSKIMQNKEQVYKWILDGAKKYYVDRALNFPVSVKNEIKKYNFSQDTVGAFLKESIIEEEGSSIMARDLYYHYQEFCFVNGCDALSLTKFGREVKKRGIKFARIGNGMKYYDIEIQ